MNQAITGLDHARVGVRDLESARAAYARLGFTLTPRGSHIGWGTANYCIMFPRDYVELLGVVDSSSFTNNLDKFLERREGLVGVAFATDDAEAAYRALDDAGVAPEAPKDLARNLELPEGTVQPRFRLVHLPARAAPALPALLCQHLTPEMIRNPEWLDHTNGGRALAGITVVVADPPALAAAYAKLLGEGAVAPADDMLTVRVGQASLVFARPDAFARRHAGIEAPGELPVVAGMTVAVDDGDETAAVLRERGVTYARGTDGALVVPPSETCGVVLEFAGPVGSFAE